MSNPTARPLYERLVSLAADVPAGAEGVRADPLFSGSRSRPHAKAAFRELTATTLTAGHLTRALLEGMAVELADSYREAILLGSGARAKLVGAGNGIKLNPVLRAALEAEFAMPLHVGPHGEEARRWCGAMCRRSRRRVWLHCRSERSVCQWSPIVKHSTVSSVNETKERDFHRGTNRWSNGSTGY